MIPMKLYPTNVILRHLQLKVVGRVLLEPTIAYRIFLIKRIDCINIVLSTHLAVFVQLHNFRMLKKFAVCETKLVINVNDFRRWQHVVISRISPYNLLNYF